MLIRGMSADHPFSPDFPPCREWAFWRGLRTLLVAVRLPNYRTIDGATQW
jgi:hypothetical protein